MKITLVRHAESIYNEKGLFQGQADCPLSARGIKKQKRRNY